VHDRRRRRRLADLRRLVRPARIVLPRPGGLVEGLWTGDLAWDDEQGQELFRRYQVYATEMLEDGVTGLAHDAAIVRYAAGDVAFAPTGVWQAPALEGAEPGFEWTYIPFPGSDNAEDNQYLFGKYDQSWAIAGNTPVPELAKAYLAAFSEPETYNASSTPSASCRRSPPRSSTASSVPPSPTCSRTTGSATSSGTSPERCRPVGQRRHRCPVVLQR
jgi:hypothetical protein